MSESPGPPIQLGQAPSPTCRAVHEPPWNLCRLRFLLLSAAGAAACQDRRPEGCGWHGAHTPLVSLAWACAEAPQVPPGDWRYLEPAVPE